MTETSVRNDMTQETLVVERGLLPVAPLAMPAQRLEPSSSWLRELVSAPVRLILPRSREV